MFLRYCRPLWYRPGKHTPTPLPWEAGNAGPSDWKAIGKKYMAEAVGTIHLLLAILRERINTTAAYLEREWHISFNQLADIFGQPHYAPSETTQASAEQTGDVNENNWQPQRGGQQPKNMKKGKTTALDKYGRDLTKLAEEGQLDPMVGREVEIERVVQILSRRKKNNPILIGEPNGSSP